ncbi:rod shape-determining protein MreC [Oleiagrimonas sp. MCCC 1A03011]|jgi:rod shape-determining protein MreC|uniref:rod shape-determining protein MreC n=1 Tax=Oleiagrimonas sp. MCCC 1A03011 TaxID=1926883 RepID=UPI000DC5FD09|nr:rod shape-determining protein MreC [Oleiagrimonas sp. MCCC 1A03011]RAP59735.1 rod shape-determining protein MreC [Oleiagrimonas sp. MCCC 1A03011]
MTLTRDGGSLFSANMAGTLRLIVYLAIASVLMVLDHRGHWMGKVRYGAAIVVEPLYHLAGLPASGFRAARVAFADRRKLTEENKQLRVDLLLANARLNHMAAVSRQNKRLKKLLDTRRQLGMNVQLARVIDIDLGAFSHRLTLNAGAHQGVKVGQVVIDAHGIMGQVTQVLPGTCTVMLITDPDHAIPVTDTRTGLRTVAHGSHESGQLSLTTIPVSADVRVGDKLVSSGLGGRFPPGFPVATITHVEPQLSGMFLTARAKPSADMQRADEVLLLRDLAPPVGPPAPASVDGPPRALAPDAVGSSSTSARRSR